MKMRCVVVLASFAVVAAADTGLGAQVTPVEPDQAAGLALTHATVIDGTGSDPRPDMTVLIEDGQIGDIFPTGSRPAPESFQQLDLTGRYVIPGLINTHLHLLMLAITPSRALSREQALRALERMLYSGVTTVREAAGDTRVSAELARTALAGAPAPDIYFAARFAGPTFYEGGGGNFTSLGYEPGTAPWAQAIAPETNIPMAVARAAGTGATGLKLYADMDAESVEAVVEEAHRQGLQAWAHATVFPTGPAALVRAGVDVLSHVCFVFWGMLEEPPARMVERRPFEPESVDLEGEAYRSLFSEMRTRRTVLDATARNASQDGPARAAGCTQELLLGALRSAHEAGVWLSTGTDYFLSDGEPDPTLFTEIEYLVENDVLSPVEVIRSATLNGAHAIGIASSHGSIETGKVANLVILSADPARDISALRSVFGVIKDGRLYARADYEDEQGLPR